MDEIGQQAFAPLARWVGPSAILRKGSEDRIDQIQLSMPEFLPQCSSQYSKPVNEVVWSYRYHNWGPFGAIWPLVERRKMEATKK
jgi:hypothetical protein